jgi:hypothetical protein
MPNPFILTDSSQTNEGQSLSLSASQEAFQHMIDAKDGGGGSGGGGGGGGGGGMKMGSMNWETQFCCMPVCVGSVIGFGALLEASKPLAMFSASWIAVGVGLGIFGLIEPKLKL